MAPARTRRAALFAVAVAVGLAGCGPRVGGAPPAASASDGPRDVAAIHSTRCGSCHVRVEPGERTRAAFEAALARHHRRVKMTDEEWRRMIDYLAADGKTSTGAPSAPTTPP